MIESELYSLKYPYTPLEKITSINLSKAERISRYFKKELKGQYLAFEDGSVMNVRSHEGYVVELEIKKISLKRFEKNKVSSSVESNRVVFLMI